jgi:cytochrome P450
MIVTKEHCRSPSSTVCEFSPTVLYLFQIANVLYDSTSGRKPTLEDISRLTYVEATLAELMRIETVLPLSLPRKTLDDTEIGGFVIPKGTMVSVNYR